MTTTHPSHEWSDAELDAALAGLGVELERGAAFERGAGHNPRAASARAMLDRVRSRVVADAAPAGAGEAPEVVTLRERSGTRRRVAPALLVAAAVVVAVVVGARFWPADVARTGPPVTSSVTPSADVTTARIALLPPILVPARGDIRPIVSTQGVGDDVVTFPALTSDVDATGQPLTLTYVFECGDPRFDGDPNAPDAGVSGYVLSDELGAIPGSRCAPLGSGAAVPTSFAYGVTTTVLSGRGEVVVDVPSADIVWRLVAYTSLG